VLGGWEGNRRSGVALAMCHRLEEVYPRAHGLTKGDEHGSTPPIVLLAEYGTTTFTLSSVRDKFEDNTFEAKAKAQRFLSLMCPRDQGQSSRTPVFERI